MLWYSNVLAGAVRAALGALGIRVNCFFVSDSLRDDPGGTVVRVELLGYVQDDAE